VLLGVGFHMHWAAASARGTGLDWGCAYNIVQLSASQPWRSCAQLAKRILALLGK